MPCHGVTGSDYLVAQNLFRKEREFAQSIQDHCGEGPLVTEVSKLNQTVKFCKKKPIRLFISKNEKASQGIKFPPPQKNRITPLCCCKALGEVMITSVLILIYHCLSPGP